MDTTVQYNVHCTYMYLCSGTEPFMSGSGSDFSKRPDLRNPIHISQSKKPMISVNFTKDYSVLNSTIERKKSFVLCKFGMYLVLTLFWPCVHRTGQRVHCKIQILSICKPVSQSSETFQVLKLKNGHKQLNELGTQM